jgi:hypothetical protein
MCVKCHRHYDEWGKNISEVKKRYWAGIPVEERNKSPETRSKNSEAQKTRWANMDPDKKSEISKKISESNKRTKRLNKNRENTSSE